MGLAGSHCHYDRWFAGASAPGVDNTLYCIMRVVLEPKHVYFRAKELCFCKKVCLSDTYLVYLQLKLT